MAGVEIRPPDPAFRPKTGRPPFAKAANVDVDGIYQDPTSIASYIDGKLVQQMLFARFTVEDLQGVPAESICGALRVLQLLFDAGECDIKWYQTNMNYLQEKASAFDQVVQEKENLEALNRDLDFRLQDRQDAITELKAEVAEKRDTEQQLQGLQMKFNHISADFERHRISAEEYRKTTERRLQKAAEFETKTRHSGREQDRDLRATQSVIEQLEDDLEQARRELRSIQSNELTLQQELRDASLNLKGVQRFLDEANEENEELKIRLEEKDDQCLSLEKRAVDDLQAFRGKTTQVQAEKDRHLERLRRECAQLAEQAAVHKEEMHNLKGFLAEMQQQTDDNAENAAVKEKECKRLRTQLERERHARPHGVQDSQHLGFVRHSGGASPLAGYDASARDDYIQLAESLRAAKREVMLEQAKLKDAETERSRLDRDVAELRKQLDVYESSGTGAANRDMRQQVADMKVRLDEREDAVSELRDRLNQGDEDLDTVLQVTESLKQLALSLGVSRDEIEQLAHRADTTQRKMSELEELEEKIRVRDKEIELLEQERQRWKKQVRLQTLPRLEQAQRMGLTPDQLTALSEITDKMRESNLSDVQALVGEGPDVDNILFNQTRHAELERKLQVAKEKNDALGEMHQRLRSLYMEVSKERDERRIMANIGMPDMQGNMLQALLGGSYGNLDEAQKQNIIAQLLGQEQPEEAADGTDTTSHSDLPSANKPSSKTLLPKPVAAGQQTSPFFQRLSNLGPNTPLLGDDRLTRLASDYKENTTMLHDLKKELQRTNDALEHAEQRSKVYMEERDAFRRTLALREQRPAIPTTTTTTTSDEATVPQTAPPSETPPRSEVWDTREAEAPALQNGGLSAEIQTELSRLVEQKDQEIVRLLEQNEKQDKIVQDTLASHAKDTETADITRKELQLKGDELQQVNATAKMLRESLSDVELLLREERARLEEHQEFIAGLGGEREGDAVRFAITEALRKVTTMRVNELRLVHRYKMCKAETEASRQRLMSLETQHESLQRSLTQELLLARSQLKESEGIQKILHDRLELIENTRTHSALREQLTTAQLQLQELLAIDRGILDTKSEIASIKSELEFEKAQASSYKIESEAWREKATNLANPTTTTTDTQLQTKVIELDVEVKEFKQKTEQSKKRAENANREAQVLEEEKQEMKLELLLARKEKVSLLDRIKTLEGAKEETMPLTDVHKLQQRADNLERSKASLEAQLLHATDMTQAAVEADLTVTQIQQNYREEIDMLRRVIDGMDPASEEGFILGEMQYRTLQQTVENIHLKKEKDRNDLALVAKRQQTQTLQVQNTQLMADLSRIYNDFITKSHELHQQNNLLQSDAAGRLTAVESRKLNTSLQNAQEKVQQKDVQIRSQTLRLRQMDDIQRDSESIRNTLKILNEKDLSKVELDLKRKAGELSTLSLNMLQGEWEVDQLREEVKMLRRVKENAEEKMKTLHGRTVELQEQRDSANSEFTQKIEDVYEELKRTKAREAVISKATSSSTASPRRQDGPRDALTEAHCDDLSETIKQLRVMEGNQNRTIAELRTTNTDLRATVSELEAGVQKKERIAEALQKEILSERIKAKQSVDRVRSAETSRGEAMSEVAKLNIKTMQELLHKKDAALTRLNTQIQAERQKFAAEKQIDNTKVSRLHAQLHQQNSDQLKKFSDRLDSITLAPPLHPDDQAPNSLADIKLAQMTAELARLQSKLTLADTEVRRLQREKQEVLDRSDIGHSTPPRDTMTMQPDPDVSISSELAAKMKQEINSLGEELRRERARAHEATTEAEAEKARARNDQEERTKAAAARSTKEVEVSTDGLQDMIALHEEAERAAQDMGDTLQRGARVISKRQVFFKSGRTIEIGDCGVVTNIITEGTTKGEDRVVEVSYDSNILHDARPGVDVELAPNPAFTVYHDTPIDTVNSIILQRETLIRRYSLQIDFLERDLVVKTKEISRLVDVESLAQKGKREAEAKARELQVFVRDGVKETTVVSNPADLSRLEDVDKELQQQRREYKIAEAEKRDLLDAVRNLKKEVAQGDTKLQLERRKMDEELAARFDNVQQSNAENVKSLQARLRAMEADMHSVLDREILLKKETRELTSELHTEKTAKQLAQQAVHSAAERRSIAASTSPHRTALSDSHAQTRATSGSPIIPLREMDATLLRSRVAELEHEVQSLETRNAVLQGSSGGDDNGRKVEALLREKAEWRAIQEAMLRHLQKAQHETLQKEQAIHAQLEGCRNGTEVRVRQVQNEAEMLVRQKDVRIARLENQLAERDEKSSDDLQASRDLEEANTAVANLKGELARSENVAKSLRQKMKSTEEEDRLRKERAKQTRTDKAAARRSALREIGTNTVDSGPGNDYSTRKPRVASHLVQSSKGRPSSAHSTHDPTSTSSGSHTQELMKYWEENKKLKKQLATLKQKEKKSGASVPSSEHEKLKTEAAQVYEELQFTKEKLREKGEELTQRAVDMHTFDKVKGFKLEVMKLEEQNEKLRTTIAVDKEMEIHNLQYELKKKNEALAEYDRLAGPQHTLPPSEVLPSEPHRVINSIINDLQTATTTTTIDKVEGLRHMFNTIEDSLIEAKNHALQLRYTKEAASTAQTRAERHLKDLMSIAPSGFTSVDDVYATNIENVASGGRPQRDRQMHDMQQVIEGLRQVIQKLQTDNDTLRKNGVSNQKYVTLLKEHKSAKSALEALEEQIRQKPVVAPPTATTTTTDTTKRLKKEQDKVLHLQAEVATLKTALEERNSTQGETSIVTADLKAKLSEVNSVLRVRDDEIEKLRIESRILSEEVQIRRRECEALKATCEKLEADLSLFGSDFLEEVAEMQRENEQIKAENARLEERLRLRGVLAASDEPIVSNVASLRQRSSSLRTSIDSLTSFSSDDRGGGGGDHSVSNRIADILRTARSGDPNTSTFSSVTSDSATLDLSSFPDRLRSSTRR